EPDRAQREDAVARAVRETEKRVEPLAQERAQAILLEELVQSGGEVQKLGGTTIVRNGEGLVVLRAKQVLRVGRRRYLLFTVQNVSAENFDVRAVRLWLDQKEMTGPWKMARTAIAPNDEPYGAIALPPSAPHGGAAKAKFLIEE